MAQWFLCKIKYAKEEQNGKMRAITEAYLVDALSFIEAESRLAEKITDTISEYKLMSISKMRLADIFEFDEGDKWFSVRVFYLSFDERSQKEKKMPYTLLVNAENMEEAHSRFTQRIGMLTDYEITEIKQTSILEIYPYKEN